jgi:hypothetical protein
MCLLWIAYKGALGSIGLGGAPPHQHEAVISTSSETEFLTSAASDPGYLFIGGSGTSGKYAS